MSATTMAQLTGITREVTDNVLTITRPQAGTPVTVYYRGDESDLIGRGQLVEYRNDVPTVLFDEVAPYWQAKYGTYATSGTTYGFSCDRWPSVRPVAPYRTETITRELAAEDEENPF